MINRKYFKSQLAYERQAYLCPEAKEVLAETISYCEDMLSFSPVITATVTTIEEDSQDHREHDQHRRRVAFDVRAKDVNPGKLAFLETYLDNKFKHYAYVTFTGKPEVAYCHGEGDNIHFHIAVNARYKLPEFTGVL